MQPIEVWVFMRVEVTTDGAMVGRYWLQKLHTLPAIPPVGMELDYRAIIGQTVQLQKVLFDPQRLTFCAYQDDWISIGVGDLSLWEHAGWKKLEYTSD